MVVMAGWLVGWAMSVIADYWSGWYDVVLGMSVKNNVELNDQEFD